MTEPTPAPTGVQLLIDAGVRLDQSRPERWVGDRGELAGDGFDFIDEAGKRGWHAVPAWGAQGWDLGDWPLVIMFVRLSDTGYGCMRHTEGDLDVWMFEPTAEGRTSVSAKVDEWAIEHWRRYPDDAPDLPPEGEPIPEQFRGAWGKARKAVS